MKLDVSILTGEVTVEAILLKIDAKQYSRAQSARKYYERLRGTEKNAASLRRCKGAQFTRGKIDLNQRSRII